MQEYSKKVEIRWSDLDPNFHLRHSVYYDIGAYCRIAFMNENLITPAAMQQFHVGPIIFREECLFKKEIKFGDEVMVNVKLNKCREDSSRWTMVHELWINSVILAAIITIDGAWIDTTKRKLTVPPGVFITGLNKMPRSAGFRMESK